MLVCVNCFGESRALATHFEREGVAGDCPTCGTTATTVLDAGALTEFFQGLEAYFEPLCGDPYRLGKDGVYGMSTDTGHEDLVSILREDWEVFSELVSDEAASEILHAVWPGFTGDYMRLPSRRWREVEGDIDDLRTRILEGAPAEPLLADLLDPWIDLLTARVDSGTWFRARIQAARHEVFPPEGMGAPPADRARFGRANPNGVPHLYLASDALTAVAEVRAEPGHWVSVATVELTAGHNTVLDLARDVRIIDPFAYSDLEGALMARAFLDAFRYEMSRPILAEDQERDYRITQAVAAHFRSAGFAGIIFPSSVAAGVNAVLFDPEAGRAVSVEERGVWAKSLDVVDAREFDKRLRARRGLPF